MKKIMMALALACMAGGAYAQSIYDAAKATDKDLNGTARFVGMGGAMGALGGDISTMGTNPAGIGLFRSNDIMTSFSFNVYNTDATPQNDNKVSNNKNRFSFDNIGFVYAQKMSNEATLRYLNFGFNYHRSKTLYGNMNMGSRLGKYNGIGLSQTLMMEDQAYGVDNNTLSDQNVYNNNDMGWLSALGWNGYLLNETGVGTKKYSTIAPDNPYSTYLTREKGGVDEYDFNVALNLSDRIYLGFTLGIYDMDYHKYTEYGESFNQGAGYMLKSWDRINGTGGDIKMGVILRPIESSPFRIGLAVHSPIFYELTYTTSARLESDVFMTGENKLTHYNVDTYDKVGDMKREFNLQTPWKFQGSLGYTIGSSIALGAEYEYADYSSIKFKDRDNNDWTWETGQCSMLKGVHTLRLGAEYKVIPEFAFRLGYNYITSAFKSEAFKSIPLNSIMTDTGFANAKACNNYTFGLGYRGASFYADFAYQLSKYNSDFYSFYNTFDNNTVVTEPAAKMTKTRSQVLLTLGMRF